MNQAPSLGPVGVIAPEYLAHNELHDVLAAHDIRVLARAPDPQRLGRSGSQLATIICVLDALDADGLALTRAAREVFPRAAIVAVSPDGHSVDARRALRAGIDGIVAEADLAYTLVPTLRAVSAGLACVSQRCRSSLEVESLSSREKQVLSLLVSGYTNGEIADKLFLAESTVKSHLSSAYTKLGVRSRRAAANLILDPEEGLGPGILTIAAA